MDPSRRRRGWHDRVARSIVVDVRPEPDEVVEADRGPRHVVNLTAMRLVPAASGPPPRRVARPATPRRRRAAPWRRAPPAGATRHRSRSAHAGSVPRSSAVRRGRW